MLAPHPYNDQRRNQDIIILEKSISRINLLSLYFTRSINYMQIFILCSAWETRKALNEKRVSQLSQGDCTIAN